MLGPRSRALRIRRLAAPALGLLLATSGAGCATRRSAQKVPAAAGATEAAAPAGTSAAPAASTPAPAGEPRVPAAVLAAVAAFNAHDAVRLANQYSLEAVVGGPGPKGWSEQRGRAPLVAGHKRLFAGFPDLRMEPVRFLVQGDLVLQEWITRGHALGESIGGSETRAQGRPVAFGVATLMVIGSGFIARDHTYLDGLELALQTGRQKGAARREPPAGAAEVVVAAGDAGESQRAARVRQLYAAIEQKRWQDVEKQLPAAVAWRRPGAGQDWVGRPAVVRALRAQAGRSRTRQVVVRHLISAGPYVAAEIVEPSVDRARRNQVQHRLDVFRFAPDGNVESLRSYADRREAFAPPAP